MCGLCTDTISKGEAMNSLDNIKMYGYMTYPHDSRALNPNKEIQSCEHCGEEDYSEDMKDYRHYGFICSGCQSVINECYRCDTEDILISSRLYKYDICRDCYNELYANQIRQRPGNNVG